VAHRWSQVRYAFTTISGELQLWNSTHSLPPIRGEWHHGRSLANARITPTPKTSPSIHAGILNPEKDKEEEIKFVYLLTY
jgi:hypothetical protein